LECCGTLLGTSDDDDSPPHAVGTDASGPSDALGSVYDTGVANADGFITPAADGANPNLPIRKIIFATANKTNGTMSFSDAGILQGSGLGRADSYCNAEAKAAGLDGGPFVAWLSVMDGGIRAVDRLGPDPSSNGRSWHLPNGSVVFPSTAALASG